jgi:DNA polymerase-3 subunit delta
VKPEELESAIARGEISPLYYFYGDEPYLMERGINRLMGRLVDPTSRDFNLNVYYGPECKGEEVADTAQTLPMFAEWRVVLVKRGESLSTAALDQLLAYVQNPSPSSCLIIQGEKIDQRKKFFTEIKKNGVLVECKRPYENQLGGFIRSEAGIYAKKIDPAAAEMLVHLAGNNLQELASQIEKVALYIGDRGTIELGDVRNIVSDTKVDNVFELANALGVKDLPTAMRRLQTILRDGEAPLMLLAMITRHFRQIWQVRELVDGKASEQEIAKKTGINPYFLKGMLKQAKNFSPTECRTLFELLLASDLSMKSGGKPTVVIGELVMKICRNSLR